MSCLELSSYKCDKCFYEINTFKNEIAKLKKMVLEQQETIKELKTIVKKQNINEFGNENTEYITQEFMIDCIKENIYGVCNMILHKHFNENHPENHNIRKLNKKDKFIDCYDGNRWYPRLMDDVFEDIFTKMEQDFSKVINSISKNDFDEFVKNVGVPLSWNISDKKKESLKNDIYMLACEYIYRESKKQQASTSSA